MKKLRNNANSRSNLNHPYIFIPSTFPKYLLLLDGYLTFLLWQNVNIFPVFCEIVMKKLNCSDSKEISCLLWNQKVNYHVQKCPPLFPILIQLNADHTLPPKFIKIHLNIILPFVSM
jgi:hypothetical protein